MKQEKRFTTSPLPQGEHIFRINICDYMKLSHSVFAEYTTNTGYTYMELFCLQDNSGKPIDKNIRKFGQMAKAALNEYNLESVETDDLIGRYFKATVTHNMVNNRLYVNLTNRVHAEGFKG